MTEPKVVLYDCRGNLAEPGEGVFVHLNDYEALRARVQELEGAVGIYTEQAGDLIAENKRLREVNELLSEYLAAGDKP